MGQRSFGISASWDTASAVVSSPTGAFVYVTADASCAVIARYVIGLLHSRDPSFFTKHRPINFTTLASPHVGIMKYRGRFWQWVAVKWGYSLLGRTGDQLYTWDKYSALDERPLLEVMSDKGMLRRCLWCSILFTSFGLRRDLRSGAQQFPAHRLFRECVSTRTLSFTSETKIPCQTACKTIP